jgi:hypothetical protein
MEEEFMIEFFQAKEVLEKNQEAVIVFTHGKHFYHDAGGNGYTGNWVLDRATLEEVGKVIVYFREEGEIINRIFLGDYVGVRKSDIPDRYIIRFSGLKEVGTKSNWLEFASGGQNPISYVVG